MTQECIGVMDEQEQQEQFIVGIFHLTVGALIGLLLVSPMRTIKLCLTLQNPHAFGQTTTLEISTLLMQQQA